MHICLGGSPAIHCYITGCRTPFNSICSGWGRHPTGEGMIAYFKCLCGANKAKAHELSLSGYEIRVIRLNDEWRKEALSYGEKLPFKITNGKVERI